MADDDIIDGELVDDEPDDAPEIPQQQDVLDAEVIEDEATTWPVYDAAIEYLRNGWTPTPLRDKIPTQKRWTNLRPTKPDCWSWWVEERHNGVGIVCGAISGNLLVVDIEKELAGDQDRMLRVVAGINNPQAQRQLVQSFTHSAAATPSGGVHLYLRVTDSQTVPGNLKLAFRGSGDDAVLLAETRGEGGQVAAPPGDGRKWIGDAGPGIATEVTFKEMEAILAGFKSLDESGITHAPPERPSKTYTPDATRSPSVADAWSDQLMAGAITWADVLDPGWIQNGYDSEGRSLWVRPDYGDKTKAPFSAKGFERWIGGARPVLVVHSTSVAHLPHGSGQRLTPSRAWALCYFNGDEAAANAALEQLATTGEMDPRIQHVPTAVLDAATVIVKKRQEGRVAVPELSEFVPDLQTADWWDSRPWLRHIHTFARARMISPFALMSVVLVRAICQVPPWVTIPPIIGGRASLNLFAALIGTSGSGKTAVAAASSELMPWADPWVHVGSGEGLLHTYVQRVRASAEEGETGGGRIWKQEYHRHQAAGIVDEIDTLTAIGARQGSTLISTLRSAWSGTDIGFAYADPTKRLRLDAHMYRLGLVIGGQPTRCEALFDDEDGGLPQRFIWASLMDPGAPKVLPDSPGELPPLQTYSGQHQTMTLPEVLVDAVVAARHEVLTTGDTDGLNGHAMLNRIKIAAAVAIMENRLNVSPDDWELAGQIHAASDATRAWVQSVLSQQRRALGERRAEARAHEAIVVDAALERDKTSRAAKTIARKVHREGRGLPHNEARKSLSSKDRKDGWYEPGLLFAESAGWVRVERDDQGAETVFPGESKP